MIARLFALVSLAFLLAACAHHTLNKTPHISDAFRAESPHSILVVPVLNQSVNVNAPNSFLATISRPIAERGYYVFPVNLVKHVMESNGLSNAYMVHHASPVALAKLFGADSVLYVTINKWTAQYALLETSVLVEFSYVLKSGKTGMKLWSSHRSMHYTSQNSWSGNPMADLIVMAVSAAMTKVDPDYIPLAQQANVIAIFNKKTGLPAGPYWLKHQAKNESQ